MLESISTIYLSTRCILGATLAANTCKFESVNRTIKKLLHGTRKVDIQIMESVSIIQLLHEELSRQSDFFNCTQVIYSV
jgi:hypothetical protein